MKKYEGLFKALFIVATILFLVLFVGIFLAIGLTGAYGDLSPDDRIALSVVGIVFIFVIALFAVIAVLVYKDAKKLGMNAWMWTLVAVYAPNGVGIIIYLVFRYNEKRKKRCPKCSYVLGGEFEVCPSCGHNISSKCSECGKIVEEEWKVCPYCRTPLK